MKRTLLISIILLLLSAACRLPGGSSPTETPTTIPQREKPCGDGICDGPENPLNCPEDCNESDTLISSTSDAGQPSEPSSDEGYRKVTMTGSISTAINESSIGDFTGDYFEYAADYSIELWFPLQGGAAVQQRNSMTLTEWNDLFIGEPVCRPCEWTLDENTWEPYTFVLDASLNLGNISEDDRPADELVTQFPGIPDKVLSGVVLCPCPHAVPDDFSDPAAFPQLMFWFMQKRVNPIHLDRTESNTVEEFAISPMYNINIPLETVTYTIVPGLE